MYREVGTPRVMQPKPKPTIDSLALPPSKGSHSRDLYSLVSHSMEDCKAFDELKIYWAKNYNVKINDAVTKLNLEAVRAAMSGVEAVLKEFPQAGMYLKEFNVLSSDSIMATVRGNGVICFNPKYFMSKEDLLAVIAEGIEKNFYHKNMTPFGVGAHEAIHIVEDWLIDKYGISKDTKLRIMPRKIISTAYVRVMRTFQSLEEFKPLKQLIKEISSYAGKNPSECLAMGATDYMANGTDSAVLSTAIWQRLKEELVKMLAPNEVRLFGFPDEDFLKYGVFDEYGFIAGVKDDAPEDFKKAFEEYRRHCEKWEALGID